MPLQRADRNRPDCPPALCACPFPPPGEPLYAGVAMRAPRPILPELKPGTTPGIFSRPFFEDKHRAFWMLQGAGRSDERRVGKECVCTCRSRWSPSHYNKKIVYV